ncbi:MAG: acyl-CoA dehydrogenase family protein [Myxococcales bacterium]|nr:acyl-CoA dehydrogenase family protein [Myxococcales bacterium]
MAILRRISGNFFADNDDLRFYFDRAIDWERIVRAVELDYRVKDGFKNAAEAVEFYSDTMNMMGEFVAKEIAPYGAEIDREGVRFENGEVVFPPRLQGIFDKLKELGAHGLCAPREFGGMHAPLLIYFASSEVMARGDVSTMAHFGFHGGMALAMLIYSLREGSTEVDVESRQIKSTRFQSYIEEIVRGEAWGSMDITEPHAGSDMAALRTKGELGDDGKWRITGQKIFITSGHAKYHFVIARTEAAGAEDDPFAGLGGMSMFLVPAYEDLPDGGRRRLVAIDRVEEKLGHHGSATCALNFDHAEGHLIGKRGEGFRHMLTLMNNARIGVGFECIGLAEAAYRVAKAYAAERPSMGKSIDKHEMIADYLDEMRTDIQAMRALAFHSAFHEEMAQRLRIAELFGVDVTGMDIAEARRKHERKARRATPLLKYFASEKAVEISRRSLQIHGGNGYITEYAPERLLRDSLVMPLYEGTSQIQSLMAMKDTLMAVLQSPRTFMLRSAKAQWRAVSARDSLERRVGKLQVLAHRATQYLLARTAGDKWKSLQDKPMGEWPEAFLKNWDPKRDFSFAMLHAERFTRLPADVHIAEVLLAQALEHDDRRELLERWLERAEPRDRFLYDELTTTGARVLESLGHDRAAPPKPSAHAAERQAARAARSRGGGASGPRAQARPSLRPWARTAEAGTGRVGPSCESWSVRPRASPWAAPARGCSWVSRRRGRRWACRLRCRRACRRGGWWRCGWRRLRSRRCRCSRGPSWSRSRSRCRTRRRGRRGVRRGPWRGPP